MLDHLEYDGGSLAGLCLTDKSLRSIARLQGVSINAETADVGVGGDQIDAPELFAFRDCHNGLFRVALAIETGGGSGAQPKMEGTYRSHGIDRLRDTRELVSMLLGVVRGSARARECNGERGMDGWMDGWADVCKLAVAVAAIRSRTLCSLLSMLHTEIYQCS